MSTATSNGDRFTDMDPQRIYIGEDLALFGAFMMRSLTGYAYSTDPVEATKLVPDAATDIGTPNADGTSWQFTVKDGMTWQDGSPVKCEDFKYGVSRTFATDVITNGPQYALQYLNIPTVDAYAPVTDDAGNVTGATKVTVSTYGGPYSDTLPAVFADEAMTQTIPNDKAAFDAAVSCSGSTITYNLNQPVGDFNYAVTLGMSAVPNPTDHPGVDTGESYTTAPWSDGPYKIDSYTPGKGGSLVLVRNDKWDPTEDTYRPAYPDKVVVTFGLDPKVLDQRMMNSTGDDQFSVQYGNLQPENLQAVFTDPQTAQPQFAGRAFSDYDPYVRYVWIRTDKVTNEKIRQAMAVALPRDQYLSNLGGDFAGDLGDGLIKPNIGQDYAPTGWNTDLFGQPIPDTGNPDLAKQLIQESGESAPSLTYDYGKSDPGDKIAAAVKQALEAVGFKIKLNPIESGYYATIGDTSLQHDFGTSGWGPDWPNASTVIPPLLSYPSNDYSRVTSANFPDFTAAIKDAIGTTDRAAQAQKWQDLNKQSAQQAFYIPTIFSLAQEMGGSGIGNLYRWAPYGSWPYAELYVKQ